MEVPKYLAPEDFLHVRQIYICRHDNCDNTEPLDSDGIPLVIKSKMQQ